MAFVDPHTSTVHFLNSVLGIALIKKLKKTTREKKKSDKQMLWSNLNLISVESTTFVMVNCICQLSKRPWQYLTCPLKSPLHWLFNWDIIVSCLLTGRKLIEVVIQTVSWSHESHKAGDSLIPWEYSHSSVSFQCSSTLRSPIQAAQGFRFTLIQNIPILVESPTAESFH